MANKKAKKTMTKKDLKKTKGGLLPAVNVVSPSAYKEPGNTSIKLQGGDLPLMDNWSK